MVLLLRVSIFLCLLLTSNVRTCNGDHVIPSKPGGSQDESVIRSKPEASPDVDESSIPNEECTSQTCSTTLELSLWLKQNKMHHFIPKLQNMKLDTLIAAYELDPKILVLRLHFFSFEKGESHRWLCPFFCFPLKIFASSLFCPLFCVPPFWCPHFIFPVHRGSCI